MKEYEEILGRLTSHRFAILAIDVILNNPYTVFITPSYRFRLIETYPDDDKFVDCAIAARAKSIVTEDHHFDVLRMIDFPKVDIIGLDGFMAAL